MNKSVTCHKPDHQEKFTPLFLACREGQLQIIDLLIQAGKPFSTMFSIVQHLYLIHIC